MELILFIGLLALGYHQWRLLGRVQRLESALAELEDRPAAPAPTTVPLPRPEAAFAPPTPAVRVLPAAPAPAEGGVEPAPAPAAAAVPLREALLADAAPRAEATARPAAGESLGGVFERFVGGSLLIWIGGIALALAGLFLVRYSIQIGLVTPEIRMAIAAAFGLLLIGLGEYARSRPDGALDPRVGQALVGAGVLVLYAAAYGSHVLYGMIGLRTAALLMVAVIAAALFLALRHGAPAAVMGLLGGFLTPLLVGDPSDSSVPLLTYLAFLNLALFALAARRGWTWLAASAVLLSFAWTGVLVLLPAGQALPAGLFVLVLAVAASVVRAGGGWHLDFIRPAALGLVELAVLVGRTDLGLPAWGLYAALSAATFFLAGRRSEYRPLPAFALVLACLLLAVKAVTPGFAPLLPAVAAGIAILFAAGALPAALRGERRLLAAATACGAFAAPLLIVRVLRPELLAPPAWGALLAAAAAGPLVLAWSRRAAAGRRPGLDEPLFVAAATALLLLCLAALDLAPRNLVGTVWLALAVGAALGGRRLVDRGLAGLATAVAALGACWAAAMVPELWATLAASLAGDPALVSSLPRLPPALLVLLPPALLLVALRRMAPPPGRLRAAPLAAAGLFAAAAGYMLFKQLLGLADAADFVTRGLAERTLLNQALFLAGWLVCTGRLRIPGLDADERRLTGIVLTGLAAARLVWFDMLLHNPALTAQDVGPLPVLNLLAPAFLLSAFWLYKARRGADHELRSGVWLTLFLAALVAGVMLMVRQLFHGAILSAPSLPASESYGYSLAGLLLSIGLLFAGFRLPDKAVRLAGLLLLTLVIVKVFVRDAAALEGVLRILSFLGLGTLVVIGKVYGRVLRAEAGRASS